MENSVEVISTPPPNNKGKLAVAYSYMPISNQMSPFFAPDDYDKMGTYDVKEFQKTIESCRYFYRKDPIASTVVNKMIDIAINDLHFDKGQLSDNEFRIFIGLKNDLLAFSEQIGLEYLVTGLVVPEINYARININDKPEYKVKKKNSLYLPESMWIRDPQTIIINYSFLLNRPSYYVEVPEEMVQFIMNEGRYPDGTKDIALYEELKALYPDFVLKIRNGERKLLLEQDHIILRRRPLTDSQYPTPYLYSSLEAFKHKRNLRRMDYAIASRVISAILHTKVGNDEYPVTEEEAGAENSQFAAIRDQFYQRDNKNVERIFNLITNHTVSMEWVTPDVNALLNERKYAEINQDIFFGLGFPKILTTGETERSGASDPEFASLSPVKSMEAMRSQILIILRDIIKNVAEGNDLKDVPEVRFAPINLHSFKQFVEGMTALYDSGNLSRTSFSAAFGYNWEEEIKQKSEENDLLQELEVEEFAPQPFSPQPNMNQQQPQNQENKDNNNTQDENEG